MIEAKNLTRNYGAFVAVNDVSFSIPEGQVVGLLGHNGAGKTTIMKMLTGYLEPTGGQVIVDGMELADHKNEIQSRLGYLPENAPLYAEMSVVDYLEYVAELRGVRHSDEADAVRSAIEVTGLEEKAGSPINTLSKGYRQRVGIAQAILHRPDILILDEPTSGLDPSQIHEIRNLIRDLSKRSTIILSTHILQEVEAVCDRVLIVMNGSLALDSKLEDLRSSNSLFLRIDKGNSELASALRSISAVKNIEETGRFESQHGFRVELCADGHDHNPLIAKALVESGINLYALHPEVRDLESVFRELSSVGGTHS